MGPRRLSLITILLSCACAFPVRAQAEPSLDEVHPSVMEFLQAIEVDLRSGDGGLLTRSFDLKVFTDRATDGLEGEERAGAAKGMKANFKFGHQMAELVRRGAQYARLRVRSADGQPRALYRLLLPEGTVNYHEYYLRRDGDSVKVEDVYAYTSGELLTTTVRRSMQRVMLTKNNKKPDADKDIALMQKMSQQVQARQFERALKSYDAMSNLMKRDKLVQLLRVQAALQHDTALYETVLAEYREQFGDDGAGDLMLVDALLAKGEHDQALAAVDRVDRSVGGDPYLEILRAGIHTARGDLAAAKTAVRRAVEREPRLLAAHQSLLSIAVHEKDHVETARLLTLLEEEFRYQWKDLTTVPLYADFVASAEYKEWVRDHPAPTHDGRLDAAE